MTKKDFQLIASALKATKPSPTKLDAWTTWQNTVAMFDVFLTAQNPRFDSERFIAACNGEVK